MSRLVDPQLCPDCRGLVGPDATCRACGLALTGPLATELWRTMLTADRLVEQLRRAAPAPAAPAGPAPGAAPVERSVPAPAAPVVPAPADRAVPAPAAAGVPAPGGGFSTGLPAYPPDTPQVPRAAGRLPVRAVPLVLLGVGGVFVLVAVSLFLAVTWSLLPLALKALLMLGVTAATATGAVALSRRGLRGGTETFWTLVAGMVALDVSAAHRSDLLGLGALGERTVDVAGGLLLAGLGVGAALWVRRTPVSRCVAAEVVLVLGAFEVAVAGLWTGPYADGVSQAGGAVVLAAAGTVLLPRLREAAYALLVLAVASWCLLVAAGLADGAAASSRSAYWAGLGAWPLLAAAALAAAVALLARVDAVARTVAAGGAMGTVGAFVLLPGSTDPVQWLLVAGVGLALAAVAALAPLVWARAAAALGAVVVAGTVLVTVLLPLTQVAELGVRAPLWTGSVSLPVGSRAGVDTWPVLVLLVASAAVVIGSLRLTGERRATVLGVARASLPGLAGLGLVGTLGHTAAPLWLLVAVLALTAGAAAAAAASVSDPAARTVAGLLAVEAVLLALLAASRSDVVTAVLTTALALGAAAVLAATERSGEDRAPALVAVALVLLTSYAAYAWTLVGGSGEGVRAVVLAAVAGVLLLAAAYAARRPTTRAAFEVSTLAPALAAVVSAADDRGLAAVVLTLVGSSLALLSVLHRDRTPVGWAGSAVLAVATLTRVGEGATRAPEVYALPAAALLLGAGLWRLQREPEHPSWPLLGAGLSLALGPSLLLALPDPTSPRALLVGVGGAVALAAGASRRWQAPFLVGAGVLVVLALRFLGPLAGAVLANPLGAWVLFGVAGAALLAVGIVWERSLGRLRTASRYLTAMR